MPTRRILDQMEVKSLAKTILHYPMHPVTIGAENEIRQLTFQEYFPYCIAACNSSREGIHTARELVKLRDALEYVARNGKLGTQRQTLEKTLVTLSRAVTYLKNTGLEAPQEMIEDNIANAQIIEHDIMRDITELACDLGITFIDPHQSRKR